MKIAVITGASSGMGREFVKQISQNYRFLDEIWVIGRSEEKLRSLQKEVNSRLRILPMDLREKESQEYLRTALAAEQPRIKLLVNAAGMGKIGDVSELTMNAQRAEIRLNCEALTAVTYHCLPYMHRRSRIIQMASASAFVPQPGFAVYAATKSYVLSLSRALRAEVKKQGITVTSVCPGPVDTPFFEGAGKLHPMADYKKRVMAEPSDVVEKAVRDAAAGRAVSVYGGSMKAFRILCKLIPHAFMIAAAEFLKRKGDSEVSPRQILIKPHGSGREANLKNREGEKTNESRKR
ncbi:MAG: SDR family NAD(P)-dependent oxidoreductase [Hominisplanchenecus sp.]|nr:SDR family NAD(P)-dependent oxidoreductase [Lachnospiraceae bacterium]